MLLSTQKLLADSGQFLQYIKTLYVYNVKHNLLSEYLSQNIAFVYGIHDYQTRY